MAAFVVATILAFVLGFTAHRASICTVRGCAEIMHARTGYMLGSIGKSILWVLVILLPIYALSPGSAAALGGWALTFGAVAGGFIFGAGAAINGACAYSTMARLVDGEGTMLMGVVGFGIGVAAFVALVDAGWLARPVRAPAMIGSVVGSALLLSIPLVLLALYEAIRLWRTRSIGQWLRGFVLAPQYRLSTAALLIGLAAGGIYLLYGAAGYSTTYQMVVESVLGGSGAPVGHEILLIAALVGMFASTVQRGSFRPNWRPRRIWLKHIVGGMLMGIGAALAAGGNASLVLYSIPTLSPHAIATFAAMLVGIFGGLWLMKAAFGFEMRVICRDDLYVTDAAPPAPRGST